jgi:hypothetical protein
VWRLVSNFVSSSTGKMPVGTKAKMAVLRQGSRELARPARQG